MKYIITIIIATLINTAYACPDTYYADTLSPTKCYATPQTIEQLKQQLQQQTITNNQTVSYTEKKILGMKQSDFNTLLGLTAVGLGAYYIDKQIKIEASLNKITITTEIK